MRNSAQITIEKTHPTLWYCFLHTSLWKLPLTSCFTMNSETSFVWPSKYNWLTKFFESVTFMVEQFISFQTFEYLSKYFIWDHNHPRNYSKVNLKTLQQTSADSAVRILSGITVRCLSVKIKFKFEIRTLENPPDWKFQILTDRHRTVNPDRIRTALSADVCGTPWPGDGMTTLLSIKRF